MLVFIFKGLNEPFEYGIFPWDLYEAKNIFVDNVGTKQDDIMVYLVMDVNQINKERGERLCNT